MCVSGVQRPVAVRDNTNVQVKPKVVAKTTEQPVKKSEPTTITPKDNDNSKKLQTDGLNKQVSFKGKIPPKDNTQNKVEPKKVEEDNTKKGPMDAVKKVKKVAHNSHVVYEAATNLKAGGAVLNKAGKVAVLSSQIKAYSATNAVSKATLSAATGVGLATNKTGKVLEAASKLTNTKALNAAHHATEAAQASTLAKASKVLGRVGLTKAATTVGNLAGGASHVAHAAHATQAVKATGTVAKLGVFGVKAAGVLGKVAPGVGFAAGMVGAGFAVKDAVNSKTTAGKVANSIRVGLNVVGGVASFVPGVGTAIGIGTTALDYGIQYAAGKFGWK